MDLSAMSSRCAGSTINAWRTIPTPLAMNAQDQADQYPANLKRAPAIKGPLDVPIAVETVMIPYSFPNSSGDVFWAKLANPSTPTPVLATACIKRPEKRINTDGRVS